MPLLDNVRFFDTRILTIDTAEPERFLTSEKKNVLVDLFVKWRITDVRQYYVSRRAATRARARRGCCRRSTTACARSSATARCTRWCPASATRSWSSCAQKANEDAIEDRRAGAGRAHEARRPAAGSERVGLPPDGSGAQARGERAALHRLGGVREDPRRRRPPARGDPRPGLPRRAAHQGRGRRQGRRRSTRSAYQANPEFYAFYRSIEAYKQSFKNKSDVLVLEPNSEFFKYLQVGRQGRASSVSGATPRGGVAQSARDALDEQHACSPRSR